MTEPMVSEAARIGVGLSDLPDEVDLLVAGLGVTGAGVALDAAARGLSVLAVDAWDLAWGTSRFSSKLVHGGLRYLANGQIGVAYESAVERGRLMETIAPHLVHTLPMLIPLTPEIGHGQALLAGAGTWAGNALRASARTSVRRLPRPRRIGVARTVAMAPAVRRDGLRGALLSYDGQLEDDARLVIALARTAIARGATVRTRARVEAVTGSAGSHRVALIDQRDGREHTVTARMVVNATGVWAGGLDDQIRLRPSRGTHLVVRSERLGGLEAAVMAPVPGHLNRFVFALPQPHGVCYIGLTDEPQDGPLPDVPEVPDDDVDFLLEVINRALSVELTESDVVGAYAGLRPLVQGAEGASSADLSRRHAVMVARGDAAGMVSIVGGKLTTYRQMAQDAVDRALEVAGLAPRACLTPTLPLLGAGPTGPLPGDPGRARLQRRFGSEAQLVLDTARTVSGLPDAELLVPGPGTITLAELLFGITHEGAASEDDLLDRRTRVGLVTADRAAALPMAHRAISLANALQ